MTNYALRMSPEELGRYRLMATSAREQEADLWAQAALPGTFVAAGRKPVGRPKI